MDPDANLAEQIRLAELIVGGGDFTIDEWEVMRDRLAELVLALNEWIARGGFLPAAWREVK